ncbi:MAG: efflux RND transporter permease subunit, partial [Calditrichaeota bacterium]|nr:efflux RND transporter permease subunit [Calditrichota bacterium]
MKTWIKWMAGNHVAANILMLTFIIGGFLLAPQVKQEVFPEIELDQIQVSVVFPGAGPLEVEDGIVRPIEQAVSGVDNLKRIRGSATEGRGTVTVELIEGSDPDVALNDIKSEVDRITTIPEQAEEPVVSKLTNRQEAISFMIYGDASELALRQHAERIRDELLSMPQISQVELAAVRPYEISVEVPEATLRAYNLTLTDIATSIRRASLDLPGGTVKTEGGEVLIRTREKKYTGPEFERIVVVTRPDGSEVTLDEIATIKDTFEETDQQSFYDGKPAAMIKVFRVGKQKPTEITRIVRDYMETYRAQLPPSIKVDVWQDWSVIFQQRMDLLRRNGVMGLILVVLILAMFLELRLAFWVSMGIPTSFLGALMLMPAWDVSVNMLSLFAFILVLGMVVDDAIVVGENIFQHRMMGKSFYQASVDGASEVAGPVLFSALTTVSAFMPLMFVTGTMGKFMFVIPAIVISVLMISVVEAFFVTPAHLSGKLSQSQAPIWKKIERVRHHFDEWLQIFIEKVYVKHLGWATRNRYITFAMATAVLFLTVGIIGGGFIKFEFLPAIDADIINVQVTMPPGTPIEETRQVTEQVRLAGLRAIEQSDENQEDGHSNLQHMFMATGFQVFEGGPGGVRENIGANLGQLRLRLIDPEFRSMRTPDIVNLWRKEVGDIPGVEQIQFQADLIAGGADIGIELSHEDFGALLAAVDRLKNKLSTYDGVYDISDSHLEGKRELQLTLKPDARTLGVSESDLGTQIRSAFFGAEALRLQRGRDEVKVMVRYPLEERKSLANIENMMIRTRSGGEVPFHAAANVVDAVGYSSVKRTDQKRVIVVNASVDDATANASELTADLVSGILAQLKSDYPGLQYSYEGQSLDRQESLKSLGIGFMFALFLIFGLIAIPLRSFTQPLIIMSVIPFGFVGAIFGHLLFGFNMSLMSMFGFVALTGVVVNGGIVMIDFINRAREEGVPVREAILKSGERRFRAIMLTSLTTFFGLVPLI